MQLDLCALLSDAAELCRAWSGPDNELRHDVAVEHQSLADTVLANDAECATALFTAHVRRPSRSAPRAGSCSPQAAADQAAQFGMIVERLTTGSSALLRSRCGCQATASAQERPAFGRNTTTRRHPAGGVLTPMELA